jgi:hypothetical protein
MVTLLTISSLAAISIASPTATGALRLTSPPNGVYTCSWIASHPAAAAAARVTCDPTVFFAATSSSATETPVTPMNTDCQPVPNGGGRVGKGVFAWSTYQYAHIWQIKGNYSPSYYTWYVQKTNGVNYVYNVEFDTATHTVGVPNNIYRMGAQNHSETAQNWNVCYTDN